VCVRAHGSCGGRVSHQEADATSCQWNSRGQTSGIGEPESFVIMEQGKGCVDNGQATLGEKVGGWGDGAWIRQLEYSEEEREPEKGGVARSFRRQCIGKRKGGRQVGEIPQEKVVKVLR
jgi:hypothetical protein